MNTGNHGFVILKHYDYLNGFNNMITYTNSKSLFNALWSEWVKDHLLSLALDTPLIDLDYKEIYDSLPKKLQKKIIDKRKYFRKKQHQSNIYENTIIVEEQQEYITTEEKSRCKIVADIFLNHLEKEDLILCDAGKYGYAMLTYYKPPVGFDGVIIFTNSQKMFEILLNEWYISVIMQLAEKMNMSDLDVDIFYNRLPNEQKTLLKNQKQQFIENAQKIASFIEF